MHAAVEIDRKWIGGWESVKAVWYMYRNQISRLYRSQIPYTGSSTRTKGEVPVISTNNRKKLYQTLLTKTFLILWKHFNFKSWICRLKELCTFIYKICLKLKAKILCTYVFFLLILAIWRLCSISDNLIAIIRILSVPHVLLNWYYMPKWYELKWIMIAYSILTT